MYILKLIKGLRCGRSTGSRCKLSTIGLVFSDVPDISYTNRDGTHWNPFTQLVDFLRNLFHVRCHCKNSILIMYKYYLYIFNYYTHGYILELKFLGIQNTIINFILLLCVMVFIVMVMLFYFKVKYYQRFVR